MKKRILKKHIPILFGILGVSSIVHGQFGFLTSGEISVSGPQKSLSDNAFNTTPVNINSNSSEFGGFPLGEGLFFCSTQYLTRPINRVDAKTSKPLYSLYYANPKNDSVWERNRLEESYKRIHVGPISKVTKTGFVFVTADNTLGTTVKGEKKLQLYKTKAGETLEISELDRLPINSNDYSMGHPSLSPDEHYLYFASDMPGGYGGVDLYRVELKENGEYGVIENLGSQINTVGNEMFPWVSEDGLLFFSSNGYSGEGGLDVYVSYPHKEGFHQVTNLGKSINSSSDDFCFIMNSDNKTGYYSSNKSSGKGDDDIYSFQLNEPLIKQSELLIVLKDVYSGTPITGEEIEVIDKEGNKQYFKSDSQGEIHIPVTADNSYVLNSKGKTNYLDQTLQVETADLERGSTKTINFNIEKDPGLSLYGQILDKQTGEKLSNVTVKIIDNLTGKEVGSLQTNENGELNYPIKDKHLGDRVSYNLELQKEGYLSVKQTYNKSIETEGRQSLNELDVNLTKVDKGSDLAKLIDLKPIYFNYNKFDITPQASIELEKIIKIMNENPSLVIELGSHTDSRGGAEANLKLSDKRAKASTEYIRKRITNPTRISGKGYGETKLLNQCGDGVTCSEADHGINRRTEFIIIKM